MVRACIRLPGECSFFPKSIDTRLGIDVSRIVHICKYVWDTIVQGKVYDESRRGDYPPDERRL